MLTRVYCRKCRKRKVIINRFWLRKGAYTREDILHFIREHFRYYHGYGR